MGQGHGNVRIEQADGRIQLEERQEKHCRWRHAVGQQPEEQVFVAKKAVAREGIGCRQGHAQGDHRVQAHVVQRVDVAAVPTGVGEDHPVVVEGEVLRPQGQAAEDLGVALERHVQQPVDRHQQEQDVQQQRQRLAQVHGRPLLFVGMGHGGIEQP
ncbi:hypothetical protein D3C81_1489690 [compost metagenome]